MLRMRHLTKSGRKKDKVFRVWAENIGQGKIVDTTGRVSGAWLSHRVVVRPNGCLSFPDHSRAHMKAMIAAEKLGAEPSCHCASILLAWRDYSPTFLPSSLRRVRAARMDVQAMRNQERQIRERKGPSLATRLAYFRAAGRADRRTTFTMRSPVGDGDEPPYQWMQEP